MNSPTGTVEPVTSIVDFQDLIDAADRLLSNPESRTSLEILRNTVDRCKKIIPQRAEHLGTIATARAMYSSDNDISFDAYPVVSPNLDGSGVWVSAWVRVDTVRP
jgi:hypothetical protein